MLAGSGKRFLSPRIPVDGVFGVLTQVEAGFFFETIRHELWE